MLLFGEENLRVVVLFSMNQRAEDLMMGAPSEVSPRRLGGAAYSGGEAALIAIAARPPSSLCCPLIAGPRGSPRWRRHLPSVPRKLRAIYASEGMNCDNHNNVLIS
jgi:hypothetical protein